MMLKKQTVIETQIQLLEKIINDDKLAQVILSRRINKNLDELKKLKNLNNLNTININMNKRIYLTNHFIKRYSERVTYVEPKKLKTKLIDLYSDIIYKSSGKCKIIHEGFALVVRDYTFITIHKN